MSKTYNQGTTVEWSWGNASASGQIEESYTDEVTKTIKGTEVTRQADSDNPAYLIKQDDGDRVLKSHSEVNKK
jgi:hypothetical protein